MTVFSSCPNIFNSYFTIIQAGVIGLTKTVAREYAGRSITCNAIAPGYIESDMTKAIDPKYTEGILKQIPLGETSILNQTGSCTTNIIPGALRAGPKIISRWIDHIFKA